jgi:outer membrane protein assembly factor BamB
LLRYLTKFHLQGILPMNRHLLALVGTATLLPNLSAADWTQFRGNDGTGVSTETKLPAEWSATKNVAWKVSLPGVAWSCPIVVGDKVFVTTAITDNQAKPGGGFGGGGGPGGGRGPGGGGGGRGGPNKEYTWKVVCLNRDTGKEEWSKTAAVGKPKYGAHASNTFASETPVTDGERVYAYFASSGTVIAYDLKGNEVWKKEIGSYPTQNNWGTASSPVLHEGKLFLQCDNEEKSFVMAFNAVTGKEEWRTNRNERTSWSTPYIWKTKNRTDLVVLGPSKAIGYDPSTGKSVWELSTGGGQCNTTPVGSETLLYLGSSMGGGGGGRGPGGGGAPGSGGPGGGGGRGPGGGGGGGTLYAVKAGATGDITPKAGQKESAGVVWSVARAMPAAASPLLYDGHIYTFDRQGGTVSCFDAKTGEAKYTKERIPRAGAFWASPWAYDGKIFALDDSGTTHVLKPGDVFEVLKTNSIGKDTCWSTPAVSGGNLIIRGVESIYCIR